MDNNLADSDIPLGLGMAFAHNVEAMKYFTSLSKAQQQDIINKAHSVQSKKEMQAFVAGLGKNSELF